MPRRVMQGVITSKSGDKTVVVNVERLMKHPLYQKTIRRSKRYHAHDEGNAAKVGDMVRIQECRPLSKLKNWIIVGDEA
ncbi:MAG: 30S ribosomal protein S17 [Alphaproteobacteria bacterium]|jgi:small subunit ribosomal protein S17|nr:30S ribosomal protein S17 [Rhodospirillaceae bacterium]MBT6205566.1 30S ribosomal protein S17 [Rhodospirillaceae bacterium]MBT6508832.1 30S ribosomal protein S17 [Rhodospirillaceae bacterium]MBT7614694.1 30S ribosomal protein S17 [Rhodospirillaceae bacterium]MDG2482842.1 30S ribosomal protein S17 [Alphaproteobacteria bacterium]